MTIPNYHFVDGGLYRSGRPQPSDYPLVKDVFQTVLSLEGTDEDEKEAAGLDPVCLLPFPIDFFEIYATGIPQERLQAILQAIEDAPKPILIHCQHGEDRTGLVIAAWRVRHGWTKDAAMDEAKQLGYCWWLNFGLNATWRDFQ